MVSTFCAYRLFAYRVRIRIIKLNNIFGILMSILKTFVNKIRNYKIPYFFFKIKFE